MARDSPSTDTRRASYVLSYASSWTVRSTAVSVARMSMLCVRNSHGPQRHDASHPSHKEQDVHANSQPRPKLCFYGLLLQRFTAAAVSPTTCTLTVDMASLHSAAACVLLLLCLFRASGACGQPMGSQSYALGEGVPEMAEDHYATAASMQGDLCTNLYRTEC